jgi:predicted amidophosphoribosyltransferase
VPFSKKPAVFFIYNYKDNFKLSINITIFVVVKTYHHANRKYNQSDLLQHRTRHFYTRQPDIAAGEKLLENTKPLFLVNKN